MRRRDFTTGIAASTAAWPLAVHAQQPERVRHIGVLMAYGPGAQSEVTAFRLVRNSDKMLALAVFLAWSRPQMAKEKFSAWQARPPSPGIIDARATLA